MASKRQLASFSSASSPLQALTTPTPAPATSHSSPRGSRDCIQPAEPAEYVTPADLPTAAAASTGTVGLLRPRCLRRPGQERKQANAQLDTPDRFGQPDRGAIPLTINRCRRLHRTNITIGAALKPERRRILVTNPLLSKPGACPLRSVVKLFAQRAIENFKGLLYRCGLCDSYAPADQMIAQHFARCGIRRRLACASG